MHNTCRTLNQLSQHALSRENAIFKQILDLRQELQERTDDLDASRAANRDLMTLANRTSTMAQPETAGI